MTLQEYTCLSTKVKSNSLLPFFNLTPHHDLNNPIFINNPKNIPLPTSSINPTIVDRTINNLKASLLWKYYFLDEPEDTNPTTRYNPNFKLLPRPDITPFPCRLLKHIDPELQFSFGPLRRNINQTFSSYPPIKRKSNNPIKHLLAQHPDTFLTLADKNLGFVALPKSLYIEISLAHLHNEDTYLNQHSTIHEITTNSKQAFKDFIDANEQFLHPNELKFLGKQSDLPANLPAFKSMPKLHKTGPLKSRPIITAFNWYTRPIALVLNERLRQYTQDLPYTINSSKALLSRLPDYLLPNQTLVTIDVKAMYPSINRAELFSVINNLQDGNPLINHLLSFILNNSYCHFLDQTYLQIQGIPMGDNSSVDLANLFCNARIDPSIAQHHLISKYYRYIDDIFIIWNGSSQELHQALAAWNTLSSLTLELTQYSHISVDFLDVTLNLDPITHKIHSSIYFKPISKFNYLSPSSCHPPHVLRGWILAEINRHYELTSHPTTRDCNLQVFKEHLLTRGYTHSFLNSLLSKARALYINPPIAPNPNSKILHCILPYYPDIISLEIANHIKEFLKTTAQEFFPGHRPLIAYSKLPNLASCISKLS